MALSCRPTMCIRDSDTTGDMVSPGGLSTFIAVGKNTKHPEEAFRFAQFVASEEAAVYLAAQGVLPAYSSDAVKESFAEACGVAGASTLLDTTIALESPNVAGYTEVAAVFQEEKEMYLTQQETIEEFTANMTDRREAVSYTHLFAAIFENVVDRHHHDDARQRRRQGREHKAQPDAAHGVGIGEQAGDSVRPRFELAAVGHELIILRPKEVDQREITETEGFGADGRIVLESEQDDHHHGRHIDDEQHVGVDVRQHVGHGVDRKSTRLNSSHRSLSRMPSSA